MKKAIYLLFIFLSSSWICDANNVQITNMSIINNGPGAIQVQFDVTWDNSWRTNVGPANYDGVWVFFKYKNLSGDWTHINLTGTNNVAPFGYDIFQNASPGGSNRVGAMIFRESYNPGPGTASALGVKLGVINTLPYDIDVKGFAIEMVYVPGVSGVRTIFGDGNGTTESANAFHYTDNLATNNSVLPLLADANGLDDAELETDGLYTYSNDTIQTTNPIGVLEAFPTMKALWCMKYELSQAAYRDFLNTLDSTQQVTRTVNPPTSPTGTGAMVLSGTNRNYIEIATPATLGTPAVYGCDANNNNIFNEATDGEWVACNFINWQDMAAYLDWSGLAPMTELQFEHICRGTSSAGANPAVLGEFAWGTNTIYSSLYTTSSLSSASENISNASPSIGNGIYGFNTPFAGPMRNGIFATATSNRITSGSSYYGVMDMSGNLAEYTIHYGSVAGRSCHYVPNGNGVISDLGNAQLAVGGQGYWPGMEGNSSLSTPNSCIGTCEVSGVNTGCAGIRMRGGSYFDTAPTLAVSDRGQVYIPTARTANRGGRGVLYIR